MKRAFDFTVSLILIIILLPIVALLAVTMILSVLTMKSMTLRTLLCGSPSVLISRGKLDLKEKRLLLNMLPRP